MTVKTYAKIGVKAFPFSRRFTAAPLGRVDIKKNLLIACNC